MFERFTERARRVVVHAQDEARELKHDYIGTEHLLLGLMAEPDSAAAQALLALDIGRDAAREQVVAIVGPGEQSPSGHIPFTPRAKKVLEFSLREALELGHTYIGTEHILLGLIREGEGVAAQVLITLGGTLSRVRAKVLELVPAGTGDRPGQPETAELVAGLRRSRLAGLDAFMRRLDGIDKRLAAIERHLGIEVGRASGGDQPASAGDEPAPGGDEPGSSKDEPGSSRDEPAARRDQPAAGE